MSESNNTGGQATPSTAGAPGGTEPPKEKKNNRYSIDIWGIILCGITGLVVGVYILFGWPFNNKNRFHEINLNLHAADSVGLARLGAILEKKKQDILSMPENDDTAKEKKEGRLDSINNLIKALDQAKFNLNYDNADTLKYSSVKYSMKRDKYASMLSGYKIPDGADIELGYHNPAFSDTQFVLTHHVSQKNYPTAMTFVRKYPDFAFWAFLWLLQIVMWFLILPICLYLFDKIKELNTASGTQNRRGKSFLIAGISVTIFCIVLYEGVIDEFLITDKYFMKGFVNNLKIYSFIGYIIAFLCFSGYLYIADFLQQLQNKFKEGKDALNNLISEKRRMLQGTDAVNQIMEQSEVKEKIAANETIKEQFARAKRYFNLIFGVTAAVLSVLVLCASSLYTAANSLDVFSFYEHLSSHKYFSGDFVYLYGGVHTIMLIIFVLPARFKIYDLNTSIPELTDDAGKTASSILKNIGKTIGEVLVVSSPLLASFLQNVINSLFN